MVGVEQQGKRCPKKDGPWQDQKLHREKCSLNTHVLTSLLTECRAQHLCRQQQRPKITVQNGKF